MTAIPLSPPPLAFTPFPCIGNRIRCIFYSPSSFSACLQHPYLTPRLHRSLFPPLPFRTIFSRFQAGVLQPQTAGSSLQTYGVTEAELRGMLLVCGAIRKGAEGNKAEAASLAEQFRLETSDVLLLARYNVRRNCMYDVGGCRCVGVSACNRRADSRGGISCAS